MLINPVDPNHDLKQQCLCYVSLRSFYPMLSSIGVEFEVVLLPELDEQDRGVLRAQVAYASCEVHQVCIRFSKFHVCFCGLDSGNLKFETARTNKQHICFEDLRRSI